MRRILLGMLVLVAPAALGCTTSDNTSSTGSNLGLLNGGGGGDCMNHTKMRVAIDESTANAPLQLRIASCRLDVDACTDLCTFEIANLPKLVQLLGGTNQPPPVFEGGGTGQDPGLFPPGGGGTSGITPSECKVTFDGSTANAEIAFDSFSGGPNCEVAVPGVGMTNGGGAP